jgi:hypothetical protein
MTKIAVLGDMHCGHLNGIAAPKDQRTEDAEGLWKLFCRFCKLHGPFDHVLLTGDLIDGKAGRNGGVELITTDQMDQADIAIRVLDKLPVKAGATWHLAAGTPYHTGMSEDFERIVAGSFAMARAAVVWAELAGKLFRVRHKLNRAMNNLYKQIENHQRRVGGGREPIADFLLFGHLHCYRRESQRILGRTVTAMSCPTLQGRTDFGGRQCDGDVDCGALCIEIDDRTKQAAIHEHVVPLCVDTWGKAKVAKML